MIKRQAWSITSSVLRRQAAATALHATVHVAATEGLHESTVCSWGRMPNIMCIVQVNKLDWIVFNVALFCTMFAGVDIGLGISIGVSVILALYKSAFPKTSVLGRLPDTTVYRWGRADHIE